MPVALLLRTSEALMLGTVVAVLVLNVTTNGLSRVFVLQALFILIHAYLAVPEYQSWRK